MIFESIKTVAKNLGINLFILNSAERVESQLNRLTRSEELPIMLINGDISSNLTFNQNGFMSDPQYQVTALLLTKAEEQTTEETQSSAEEMSVLYFSFLQELNQLQRKNLRFVQGGDTNAITSADMQFVFVHGAGKHSGVLGNFTVADRINLKCNG